MGSKINLNDFNLENLNDNLEDKYFEKREKIQKNLKSPEESKDNNGHKKKNKRLPKL